MTFTRAITHSTRSAVDIFNTLHVFTKEPIREQEIKWECMNLWDPTERPNQGSKNTHGSIWQRSLLGPLHNTMMEWGKETVCFQLNVNCEDQVAHHFYGNLTTARWVCVWSVLPIQCTWTQEHSTSNYSQAWTQPPHKCPELNQGA